MRIIDFKAKNNDIGVSDHCVGVDAFEEDGKIYVTVNDKHTIQYIKDILDQDFLEKTDIQNNIVHILKGAIDKILSVNDHSINSNIHGEGTVSKYGHVYRPITPFSFQRKLASIEHKKLQETIEKREKEERRKEIEEPETHDISDWSGAKEYCNDIINRVVKIISLTPFSQRIAEVGGRLISVCKETIKAIDSNKCTQEMLDNVKKNVDEFNSVLDKVEQEGPHVTREQHFVDDGEGDSEFAVQVDYDQLPELLKLLKQEYVELIEFSKACEENPDDLTQEDKEFNQKMQKAIDVVMEEVEVAEKAIKAEKAATAIGDKKEAEAQIKKAMNSWVKIEALNKKFDEDLNNEFKNVPVPEDSNIIKEEIKKEEKIEKPPEPKKPTKVTKVLKPQKWTQKTKGRNRAWEDVDDEKWACYTIATKSGTHHQPSPITFSNFKPHIPADAKIKSVVLKYSDGIIRKRGYGWIDIDAPDVTTSAGGSANPVGPQRFHKGDEALGTHSPVLRRDDGKWTPNALNNLKLTIKYPMNESGAVGSLLLRYVRVVVEYEIVE